MVCCFQVSAGYDAHWRDPLAGLQMRNSTYHRLATQLKALADRLCGARFTAHFCYYTHMSPNHQGDCSSV